MGNVIDRDQFCIQLHLKTLSDICQYICTQAGLRPQSRDKSGTLIVSVPKDELSEDKQKSGLNSVEFCTILKYPSSPNSWPQEFFCHIKGDTCIRWQTVITISTAWPPKVYLGWWSVFGINNTGIVILEVFGDVESSANWAFVWSMVNSGSITATYFVIPLQTARNCIPAHTSIWTA